jgi:phosphomannomutase
MSTHRNRLQMKRYCPFASGFDLPLARLIHTWKLQYQYKLNYPTTIGGHKVTGIRDLTIGYDSTTADHYPTLPVSSSSEMITFKLDNGCVFTIRTSGTEPKIKYYSELPGSSAEQARQDLKVVVNAIGNELMEAEKNGLEVRKET